jgi:DNA-binding NtrC family response regulator
MEGQGCETILVVDDDSFVRRLATVSLQRYGYKVLGSRCGIRGLQCFREYAEEIQLVVTDVVMPEMSGPEMVDAILRERGDVRVLFITGYGSALPLPPHQENRFGVLRKPFTPGVLAKAVRDSLDGLLI